MTQENKKLRIKTGIILAIIQWILWFLVPKVTSGGIAMAISVFGGLGLGLVIIIWWLFFSRADKLLRWLGFLSIILGILIFYSLLDPSIKTGLSGLMYFVYVIPVVCIAFVFWAYVSRKFSIKLKIITMSVTVIIASGIWTLFKSRGINGSASALLEWRWAKTNEQMLLEQGEKMTSSDIGVTESEILWAGFRGNNRDGIVKGIKIRTNWKEEPPKVLWKKSIGPGCSSFSVKGGAFYTQEQRGEEEIVSCYNLNTGELIWMHSDKARFWDSHAGAGPRSTPTLVDSMVYTLGATGILNALKSDNGDLIWSRNAADDIQDSIPGWGYASSPLVVDSVVIVAVSGTLVSYNKITGDQIWAGPKGGENYSSPHLFEIDGEKQVVMMSQKSASGFSPYTGEIIWERTWGGGAIIQPTILRNGDILISEGYKKAMHRINVSKENGNWEITEKWMSTKIRPDFNDVCVHKNHIYGYEGLSLACIDLTDGSRKWKYGRYGGQVLLIAEQDLLLMLTEKGELVLIEANPEEYVELAKIKAIEGKTWNHPVLVNDILLVRNAQEMAAYHLKNIK